MGSEKRDGLFFHVNSRRIGDTWMISSHYVFRYTWAGLVVSRCNTATGAFIIVFAFCRSQLCLPCPVSFRLRHLVLEWLQCCKLHFKIRQLTDQLVSSEAVAWPPSFDVCSQSSVQSQTPGAGWKTPSDTKGCASSCACVNQNPLLTDERGAKWSETWGIEHICQETSVRKAEYSFTVVQCNAHSFSVAASWAFWVSSSFPKCLSPTLPLLFSFSFFYTVFPLGSAGWHGWAYAETLALCSKEGSPGGRGQKGPGRRKGTGRCENQCSMVSLGFVLCGVLSSTSRSYGWDVPRCFLLMDPLVSVRAQLTLETVFQLHYSRVSLHDSAFVHWFVGT